MQRIAHSFAAITLLVGSNLLGCGMQAATPEDIAAEDQALVAPGGRHAQALAITEIDDPLGIGDAGQTKTAVWIRSARAYRAAFGHAPPADVNFGAGEVVLFYSDGVKPTGGFTASFLSVVQVGRLLTAATLLESPGDSCFVTQALTRPFALVKVTPVRRVQRVRFQHLHSTLDCEPPAPSCDDITCDAGQHCELQEIVCITTPCDPIPTCVDDEPTDPPFCGGIAGFPCPGSGTCLDDPSDDCDPDNGGADCGGLCACHALGLCVEGFIWDESPEVCDCVPSENPCNLVDCMPGNTCFVRGGEAVCVADAPSECAAVLCPVNTICEVVNGSVACTPIGGGETCGDTTCATGEVCCNPSCGICTPPDGACIQLFCG